MACQAIPPGDAERILTALSSQRRRSVLSVLVRAGGRVKLQSLARRLAAVENRTSVADTTEAMITPVTVRLYHADLPKLEGSGYVEFDTDAGLVTLAENAEGVGDQLEMVSEMDGDSPEYIEQFDRVTPEAGGDEPGRVLAQCLDCGRGYAARVLEDGTLHLLGGEKGCRCGSDTFTPAG